MDSLTKALIVVEDENSQITVMIAMNLDEYDCNQIHSH